MSVDVSELLRRFFLMIGLGIMSVEDIRRKQIRRIWLIGLGIVGIVLTIAGGEVLGMTYVTRFIPGVICLLLAWVTGEQLGRGDAILILVMGCYLNAVTLMNVCMIAFVVAGVMALALLVVAKKSKKFALPLVPFLFFGYVLTLYFS